MIDEIENQNVELLPARTLLTTGGGSYHDYDATDGGGDDNSDNSVNIAGDGGDGGDAFSLANVNAQLLNGFSLLSNGDGGDTSNEQGNAGDGGDGGSNS